MPGLLPLWPRPPRAMGISGGSLTLGALDVGAVEVEINRIATTLHDLDFADTTHTFLAVSAGWIVGIFPTFGLRSAAAAVAELSGSAFVVA